MTQDCIFCKIEKGEVPKDMVYQNERIVAFHDIAPSAPVDVLVIPRKHIESLRDMDISDIELLGLMVLVATEIAKDMGLDKTGYRIVFNTGSDAGQLVNHIHLHLLGGENLWPNSNQINHSKIFTF